METYQTNDLLQDEHPKKLPGMLNVLTILTFIGSGLAYLGSIWQLVSNNDPDKQTEKIREAMDKMSSDSLFYKWMEGSVEVIRKSYDNRYFLLITTLLFTTLCLIGALRMRKLQKSGYFLYLVGELAPLVVIVALFGTGFAAMVQLGIGGIFAILFVILYSTQLKHLINK